MLIGLISDLHANLEATLAVLRELDRTGPDTVVSLGDLTGYGANPNEVVDLIRERHIPTIMGNHDAVVSGLEEPWFFRESAKRAVAWQAERLREDNRKWLASLPEQARFNGCCLGVHGSPSNRDEYINDWLDAVRQVDVMNEQHAHICFFGHSHKAALFSETGHTPYENGPSQAGFPQKAAYKLEDGNRYLINPGSVGQPRDGDLRAAFGLFDLEGKAFEFRRVEYDVALAQRKILKAGLPPDLASRLSLGK
jgi:predicted phosphodiesterase